MTKSHYNEIMRQRLVVGLKDADDFAEVTKYTENEFSLLWRGETHSGNYVYSELKEAINNDGVFYVEEKRVVRPEEK